MKTRENMDCQTYFNKLEEYKWENDLTNRDLSLLLNVHHQSLVRYKANSSNLTPKMIHKIKKLLENPMPVAKLLELKKEEVKKIETNRKKKEPVKSKKRLKGERSEYDKIAKEIINTIAITA